MPRPYHTNTPASYLVLMKESKVLLLKRANTGYWDGHYSLPAGHVEAGESFTRTIIRETREEIGIVLQPEMLRVVHIMHRKSDKADMERVDTFFMASNWNGDVENREPQKCSELSWHPIDRLPENTIPYIREALEYIQKGVFYSEFGW